MLDKDIIVGVEEEDCFFMRDSPLSGQKTGSFKVPFVPALNDFIFFI